MIRRSNRAAARFGAYRSAAAHLRSGATAGCCKRALRHRAGRFPYPYPVNMLPLTNEGEQVRMAYKDVAPATPNGRTVLLLHGPQLPVELLGAGDQDADRRRLSRRGAGPDRLRKILQAIVRSAFRYAGPQHRRAARPSAVAAGRGRRRIRWAACSRCASPAPIQSASHICCSPHPSDLRTIGSMCRRRRPIKIIEAEDKLTADGYRKQLVTNYSLKLPPDQVTPFIDARFSTSRDHRIPRWLRASSIRHR